MANIGLVLGFMVLAISLLATPIMAATYTIGDSNGWALGVDYPTWASTKTFEVGDSLVFNYGSTHSVLEVTSSEYVSCSLSNALSADRSGATTMTLNTPGEHYFVCGVPGHCGGGQKVEVTVSAAKPLGSPSTASSSGNSVATETPSITANAPASATSNNAPPRASSAMALSPIVSSIFFMVCGVVVSTLIV